MTMYNPQHPGEVLKNTLIDGCDLTVTEAADILGISRASLSKLVNCRGGLSPEMAIRLSVALNTTSEMWFNLQATYDLWKAEKDRKNICKQVQIVKDYIIEQKSH